MEIKKLTRTEALPSEILNPKLKAGSWRAGKAIAETKLAPNKSNDKSFIITSFMQKMLPKNKSKPNE